MTHTRQRRAYKSQLAIHTSMHLITVSNHIATYQITSYKSTLRYMILRAATDTVAAAADYDSIISTIHTIDCIANGGERS